MTQKEYQICSLSNGMRIVCVPSNLDIDYCGVAVKAGSRNENAGEEGIAHFVEHTIFKGTSRRRSSAIINRMESVGGELNAYTTKEETYVYCVAPAGHLNRAVELISDLILNSVFPEKEIDKEREVIAEEIDSYLDTPSEAVYDDFEDCIFADSPLGHNILGNRETLQTFTSKDCLAFIRRLYVPENMVFFYSGNETPEKVQKLVEKYFGAMNASAIKNHTELNSNGESPRINPVFNIRKNLGDNHQAHNIVGARIPSIYYPNRHVIALYNNVIGGPGMNSLLSMALREKRGLVYTVDSATALYSDAGLFTIYFGCNPEDVGKCMKIVGRELNRLADKGLDERKIAVAKRQYVGQMIVASASAEQKILSAARATLYFGMPRTRSEIIESINAIAQADFRAVAEQLCQANCSVLTLG